MKNTVLIVDDDAELRRLMGDFLVRNGFEVREAENASVMDRTLAEAEVDLVVLDVMMPGEDGLSACRRLAARQGPPVLMLSAAGAVTDRIVGLEVGADDFLAKPCDPREMLARIRAVMRRARERAAAPVEGDLDVFEFDGWRFHAARRELFTPSSARVALSTGEYALLRAFLERPQRILSRDQLLDLARGRDTFAYDRAVDVQVSRLRKRLESAAPGADLIRTVRNEGYLFVPAVRRGR